MRKHILRIQRENDIYFISNRTILGCFLMTPTPIVNQIISGAVARAATKHPAVELYAFSFLLNQFYMLLRAPKLDLPEFMKTLQQEIAEELNIVHDLNNAVFADRYQKSEVRGKKAILERFVAITCAPIQAGLSRSPAGWAGVCSWAHYSSNASFSGMRINRTSLGKLRRKAKNTQKLFRLPPNAGEEHYSFKLARLPGYKHQSKAAHRRFIKAAVAKRALEIRAARAGQFADIKKLCGAHWSTRPTNAALKNLGLRKADLHAPAGENPELKNATTRIYQRCYGTPRARAQHLTEFRAISAQYAEAMEYYVKEYDASRFPARTCRPGLISCEKPPGWHDKISA